MQTHEPITLIQAAEADIPALCSVYRAACENMEAEGLDLWHWGEYPNENIVREDVRQGWLYLCREGADVLGCVCVNQIQADEYAAIPWQFDGQAGLFHRIAISPLAQGKGLARRMLSAVEDILRTQGCTVLRGDVYSLNHKALRLYARFGMRQAGKFRDQFCPEPFIAIEKEL